MEEGGAGANELQAVVKYGTPQIVVSLQQFGGSATQGDEGVADERQNLLEARKHSHFEAPVIVFVISAADGSIFIFCESAFSHYLVT